MVEQAVLPSLHTFIVCTTLNFQISVVKKSRYVQGTHFSLNCLYIYIYIYTALPCVCVYIYICVCMYMYMCVYIYT